MLITSRNKELFNDYEGFVEKFKPKKTTDDCYTPPLVYDAVADWVSETYGLNKADFCRPFYPGGDYEHFDYNDRLVLYCTAAYKKLLKNAEGIQRTLDVKSGGGIDRRVKTLDDIQTVITVPRTIILT